MSLRLGNLLFDEILGPHGLYAVFLIVGYFIVYFIPQTKRYLSSSPEVILRSTATDEMRTLVFDPFYLFGCVNRFFVLEGNYLTSFVMYSGGARGPLLPNHLKRPGPDKSLSPSNFSFFK